MVSREFFKLALICPSTLRLGAELNLDLRGNTTSEYFVPSIEGLSKALKLSPTIAGTTLLPFGNGANDVFASVISFTKSHDGDVGLNSVLGGAFFISCLVVGILSIIVSSTQQTRVNESSFVRDVIFLIFSLFFLLMIIVFGRINLWLALSFVSLYFAYIGVVSTMHFFSPRTNFSDEIDEENYSALPNEDFSKNIKPKRKRVFGLLMILSALEFPLYLPRRITIPLVSEEKWSKTFAVISAILGPIFLVAILDTQIDYISPKTTLAIHMISIILGIILGNLAFIFTKVSSPPKECLLPWLIGGFLMSITWTYLIVEELVSLLISFGNIFGISSSLLGLTVLAWGNSLGDLISNVTMALNGGPNGVQIAMSSCYAGPLFNTLIGLGLSLVLASWSEYPSSYIIPNDPYLYEIVGFLIAGLLWALVILLKKNMQLDRSLGGGLLAIYFCFLFLRLAKALGLPNLDGSFISNLQEVF
ncbi:hypothetical protein M9H77_28295 [Catharanthus roseus]|uniref:Uncharacterized protein n=1 Tax=Catharanthus roseus TaxID=4058 RepID=A0ACC0AEX2_CATRO|nr:hypothetical protein M9H77_28295 [Catharanthus roseus]